MPTKRQWIQSANVAIDEYTAGLLVQHTIADVTKDAAFTGPQTNATIWQQAGGRQIAISSLTLSVDADCTVTIFWASNVPDKRFINQKFKAGTVLNIPFIPMFRCGVDKAIKVTTTGGNINITAVGTEYKPN
jgi:hypothetical protein